MSAIDYPPQRPLSVGEVLDLSFRIYRTTVVRCLLLAALGVIAGQITNFVSLARGHGLSAATSFEQLQAEMRDPILWVVMIIAWLATIVFFAAVLLRQQRLLTGGDAGGEAAAAVRRLPALIGLMILIGLACVVCMVPALLVGGLARALVIVLILGALCYLVVSISCAQTILLVEGLGPVASFARSWRLTTSGFWRLTLLYTIVLFVLLALYFIFAVIGGALAGILGRGDLAVATAASGVAIVALGALATPFYTAVALAVLGDLKVRREGADLERRISSTA